MTKSDQRGQSEPVAWMDPVWPTGSYVKQTSPVSAYHVKGWTPLFTEPRAEATEIAKAVRAEREACAQVVENRPEAAYEMGFYLAAQAIRNRAALSTPKESPPSVEEGA